MDISILSNNNLIKSAKEHLDGKIISKSTISTNKEKLEIELDNINQDLKERNKEYNEKIKNIQNNNNLSKEEKNQKIEEIQSLQQNENNIINDKILKLKNEIFNLDNNILKYADEESKNINKNINKNILKSKKNQVKANASRIKQILKNNKKSIVSIISNQLTNNIIKIINQNTKLNESIDKTNNIIDNAVTEDDIKQAIISKNSTLLLINNQESKILSIQNQLKTISTIIQIFSLLLNILSALPIPVSTPPGVGIPLNVITNITKLIEKLTKLVEELNTILSIIIPILEKIVNDLEEMKLKLHDINELLDNKISNSPDIYNSIVTNFNLLSTNSFDEYKGFKFAIREDENLGAHSKITFGEIKRHYAVAINRDGVEVLQSDYSFTQDPDDLIEQLKIIIDKQNLKS